MNAREFLQTAQDLLDNPRESDWRTAIMCAYYSAFHVGRLLLSECNFVVPHAGRAHFHVILRLNNCGHPDIVEVGRQLRELHGSRLRANYDIELEFDQQEADDAISDAEAIIDLLDQVAENDSVRARITQAMRDYERDVLHEVTWRDPNASSAS